MSVGFSRDPDRGGIDSPRSLVRAFDDPERRSALAVLSAATDPLSPERLADRLADDAEERRRLLGSLHHHHLPVLREAGLVTRTDGGTALAADFNSKVEALVERVDELPGGTWDALKVLLSERLARAVVAELGDRGRDTSVHLDRLAAVLVEGCAPGRGVEGVTTLLHHDHLPRLDEAGVVDYDPETRVVDYVGPDLTLPAVAPEEGPLERTLSAVQSLDRPSRDPSA